MIRKSSTDEPPEPERKERVIHTRVPESLEAELRQKAQDLGISVSNLVRNVLGHAFGLVGDMVADSHAIARAARAARRADAGEAAVPERDESGERDVLGWQPMVLGKNAVCARCNDLLPRGSDAAIGIPEAGGSRLVICLVCLEQLRVPPATTEEPR
ncbi:MAG TPA: hypothetical protein VFD36_20075 [Kofleriaceae bacterium]|nr:hypothetical protein [Kofleriaceae bacterium]